MKEVWKQIPNYSMYEISTNGKVRRKEGYNGGDGRWCKGKELKRCGKYVMLCKNGKRRNLFIHRLILITFVGPPPFPKAEGRHLNDVKHDDRLENLAWGSRTDNVEDAIRNGRYKIRWKKKGFINPFIV